MHFKVKYSTNMGKLKKSYSERKKLDILCIRFLIDGEQISDEATPKSLGLQDEDVIEVWNQQTGGFYF